VEGGKDRVTGQFGRNEAILHMYVRLRKGESRLSGNVMENRIQKRVFVVVYEWFRPADSEIPAPAGLLPQKLAHQIPANSEHPRRKTGSKIFPCPSGRKNQRKFLFSSLPD